MKAINDCRLLIKVLPFNNYNIVVEVYAQGKDLLIRCFGGSRPHIGAIAIAIPHLSLADPARNSATASVYALTGHKDDIVASSMAKTIAAASNKLVVVVAGIHIEGITKEEIQKLLEMMDYIGQEIICAISINSK